MNLNEGEGESEISESKDMRKHAHHSQAYSAIEAHQKQSQISGINLDSVIQEKDFSINKLQHELYDRHKSNKKWQKRFKRLQKMYKQK